MMYCPKHNAATYGSATCLACELEDEIARLKRALDLMREEMRMKRERHCEPGAGNCECGAKDGEHAKVS